MAIDKPDLTRVWANGAPSGNVVDPDDTTPGKFSAGWQAEVPPFEHFNFIQKLQTQGLAHINEQGIPVWDTETVYPINALVKGSDGTVYKSLSEQSGNDPVSSPTFWSNSDISKRNIGSVAEGFSGLNGSENDIYFVIAWHPGGAAETNPKGGGLFVYKQDVPKSSHNGGTIISPTVPPVSAGSVSDFLDKVGETDPSGNGCFVRVRENNVYKIVDFGAKGDFDADDTASVKKTLAVGKSIFVDPGTYLITETIEVGTQRVIQGQFPQSRWGIGALSIFSGKVADIGDGMPIFTSSFTGSTQAITFENVTFRGDKSINPGDLSTTDSSGLVGMNVTGTKQGMQFINCAFYNLKSAVRDDVYSFNYLDKVTFSKCHFNGLYLAVYLRPTAGVSFGDCYFDECFNWIDAKEIYLDSTRFNNSSFGSDLCQVKGTKILADNIYIEGGNNWLAPTRYLSVRASYFSEAFASDPGAKYSIRPANDGVFINVEGVRVGTNTRLFNTADSPNFSATTEIRLKGNYNGTNFGNAAQIQTYIDGGLSVEGSGNEQTDWNVTTTKSDYQIPDFGYRNLIQDKPTAEADVVDWQIENGRHRRSFYYPSPGGNVVTKQIVLRSPSTNPGSAVVTVTVMATSNNSGLSANLTKQSRVVWMTEAAAQPGRVANVTDIFTDSRNQSSGTGGVGPSSITATAGTDTENTCTIDVDVDIDTLSFGKLLITVDVDSAFD